MPRLIPSPIFKPYLLGEIYAGNKLQTRRVALPQPLLVTGSGMRVYRDEDFKKSWRGPGGCDQSMDPTADCPFGGKGARWYFREGIANYCGGIKYRLDDEVHLDANWCWQRTTLPSIHMPSGLARRFARVTAVRVERLQSISEADAWAEGVGAYAASLQQGSKKHRGAVDAARFRGLNRGKDAIAWFSLLWDSINAERGHGWATNPWVWVYEFVLISREEAMAA